MPHLLIPFAGPLAPAGREALAALELPRLGALLARLAEVDRDDGDAWSLTTPHERALARELGFEGGDGALPFAAHFAARDGLEPGDLAWGLVSPTHWEVGSDLVSLADPDALALDEAASRALHDALAPLFEAEGFALAWGAPTRWYLAHESLARIATASLDRVIGRSVDPWLPRGAEARLLRRLQSEAQMVLHTHPLNAEREARGEPAVNSFWLSGCGVRQPAREPEALLVLDALRAPALADDWGAWADAWRALDAGPIAEALASRAPLALTLAGERASVRLERRADSFLRRLAGRWQRRDPRALLETL